MGRDAQMYIVDAFTTAPFAGNPAAVCVLPPGIGVSEEWLQRVAAEMNLSETAFLWPTEVTGEWRLRWFTPEVEVPLCGHATMASAHVLFTEQQGDGHGSSVTFHTQSGPLQVAHDLTTGQLSMNFPQGNPQPAELPVDFRSKLIAALGTHSSAVTDVQYCAVRKKIVVELDNASALRSLSPDFQALRLLAVPSEFKVGSVVVTALGSDGYDFFSRNFGPWVGINEDPVTGAAHCVLGPYWQRKLGRAQFHAFQASRRGGALDLALTPEGRIIIAGSATTFLKGRIGLPE
eukprot:TRINITY_DN81055_c0_g1_i1.p1 TRINITY_DN81055_c0_g1~~TRINITY_DN81055_c0_g1_i1.p1  ORF type:complete len:290 (-),score=37.61 TRINITY_DN81055_c0_g1_i1:10-879(-)